MSSNAFRSIRQNPEAGGVGRSEEELIEILIQLLRLKQSRHPLSKVLRRPTLKKQNSWNIQRVDKTIVRYCAR